MARGIGLVERIGRKFRYRGQAYGGSCFPKDTLALPRVAPDWGAPSRLVATIVAVNDACKAGMAARAVTACGGSVRGKMLAVLELTFRPETDDMRDAPSQEIARVLSSFAVGSSSPTHRPPPNQTAAENARQTHIPIKRAIRYDN